MTKYLVVGLTSSCTKVVAIMIAYNLKLTKSVDGWDGREGIHSDKFMVTHKSLPHGHRSDSDRWISPEIVNEYDYVVVVTRDINCSLLSTIRDHQPNQDIAKRESEKGKKILKEICSLASRIDFFSYETAQILQDKYTIPFLKEIGIDDPRHVEFENVNKKYIGGNNVRHG